MKSSLRFSLMFVVTFMLAAASACGGSTGTAGSSPKASSTSKTSPSPEGYSKLDPEVAMPKGFPADVPIYTGARLTAAATFSANGQTTWGMEWETLDGIDKVKAYYSSKLSQGDWNVQFSGSSGSTFSAIFNRKSTSSAVGTIAADASSGVTKIALSFASASS